MAARTVSDLERHIGYWLRFVSNHVSHSFMRKIEAKGVTVAEWAVLRQLLEREDLNPSELAGRMGMTRGTISKLIERLRVKGLVERCDSEHDRRCHTVSLTRKGRTLVPELARLADKNDREFFGHLSEESRAALVATLKALVKKHEWKEIPVG